MHLAKISVNDLRPPADPIRAAFDEEADAQLAADIRAVGVLQPLHVKKVEGGYEVVAGHRRFRCALKAGNVAAILCLVLEEEDDPTTILFHENLFRQELSPVEEGAAFAELFERTGHDVDKVCVITNHSRAYVESRLLLLEGDRSVLEALAQRKISMGVAAELNKVRREDHRRYLLHWAVQDGATIGLVTQWRLNYNAIGAAADLGIKPPQPEPAAPVPDAGPAPCVLCGSADDQHDIIFVPLHRSCQRVEQRRAQVAAEAEELKP